MPQPKRDEKALARMSRYLKKPRTIREIQERVGICERSAYRWLEYLREEGHDILIRRADRLVRYSVEG